MPDSRLVIDTVIFDFGGVLAENGRHSDFLSRYPAEHADTVRQVLLGDLTADGDHVWHRLERGEITLAEMGEAVAASFAELGIAQPERPSSDGPAFTFRPNEPVIQLVKDLKAKGVRTGVLTNNVAELRPLWRPMLPLDELFDDVVDSSEVGLRKPNPAVYRLAMERLGATPERTAFLDDLQSNVDAAAAVGITGVFVDIDPTAAVAQVRELTGLT